MLKYAICSYLEQVSSLLGRISITNTNWRPQSYKHMFEPVIGTTILFIAVKAGQQNQNRFDHLHDHDYLLGGTEVTPRTEPPSSVAWSCTWNSAIRLQGEVLSHKDNFYCETYLKHDIIFQLTLRNAHGPCWLLRFPRNSLCNTFRLSETMIHRHFPTHVLE